MKIWKQFRWLKATISSLVIVTFLSLQIAWAREFNYTAETGVYQPVVSFNGEPLSGESDYLGGVERADEFEAEVESAAEDNPLLRATEAWDYDRYDFEHALEVLRPEFASAVIVEDLREEELRSLTELSFEVGIIVLHGEIVLFTSGSEDELGVLPAVRELLGKATFISHTHPSSYSHEGPSGHDLNEAVLSPLEEYILTRQGGYAYNKEGVLNQDNPYSFEQYLEKLNQALEASRAERDQVEARKELNQFVAEQDRYNLAPLSEREILRSGGTYSYASGLSASKVTQFAGRPYPYLVPGSSAETFLSFDGGSNRFVLGYSVLQPGDYSGFRISFDNAGTAAVETQNLTLLTQLIFGLQGRNSSVRLEIVDINGVRDTFMLTNILDSKEQFWKIPVSAIWNALDKTRIKEVNFIVAEENLAPEVDTGLLYIRTYGLNTNLPAQPIVTTTFPALTNQKTLIISGTKEANTSILINGFEVVPQDASTTWTATLHLTKDGDNTFKIQAENSIGKLSSSKSITIKRDTSAPYGFFSINSGAAYTGTQTVTAKLWAADLGSGISKVSFSADGTNWSEPEAYSTYKTVNLPSGEGEKTLYVRYYDLAGNVSEVYSKSIFLDLTGPTGSFQINSGALYTRSKNVVLNLSALDLESGLAKASFSFDGVTWTKPKTFLDLQPLKLKGSDGLITVYVKYYDAVGNESEAYARSIFYDHRRPTGSIQINSGVAYTTSALVRLSLPASDEESGVESMIFSLDGKNWSAAEPYSESMEFLLPEGDGLKKVYVRYIDYAGNASAVYSASIILNEAPTQGTVLIDGGAAYAAARDVTLTLEPLDWNSPPVQMSFSNDGKSWSSAEAFAGTKNWTLASGTGLRTVYVKFLSASGEWSSPSWARVFLDTVAPKGSVTINSGATYSNSSTVALNLLASDVGSGVDRVSFSTDGVNWSGPEAYASLKALTLPEGEGLKTVYVKYFDRAGNVSPVYQDTILVDSTAPTGAIVINNGEEVTTSPQITVTLTLSGSEEKLVMRFSVDGGKTWTGWEGFKTSKNLTLPDKGGLREIRVQLKDVAGNILTASDTIVYNRILSDGTQYFYEGDTLVRELLPEGHEVFYREDGSVSIFRYADGTEFHYSDLPPHVIDLFSPEGELLETIDRPEAEPLDLTQALRVALPDGTETYYVNGELIEVRTPAGVRVTDFTLTAEGRFENALLTYPDGRREMIRRGVLLRRIAQDGTVFDYLPTWLPVREILAGHVQFFQFDKLAQTRVRGTYIYTSLGTFSFYDEVGILREVQGNSGEHYVYVREEDTDYYWTYLDVEDSSLFSGQAPVSSKYTKAGELVQMNLRDGTQIFFEQGVISKILDPEGNEVTYDYLVENGFASGLEVLRDRVRFIYDGTGFLESIVSEEGTIHRSAGEEGIDLLLETVGGNRLTDFELDSDGNIISGIIETREGIKQRIENGILTGFETVDGRIYDYQDNEALLREWHFRDGTRVIYGGGTIEEILFPDGRRLHTIGFNAKREVESFIEELEDGSLRYFEKGRLVWLWIPEGESGVEFHYNRSGLAFRVVLPDYSEELISYTFDAQGNIQEVIFSGQGGLTRRVFKPDGTLVSLLTGGVNAELENGGVARLFTRFGQIKAPQFDTEGIVTGAIDYADGTRQVIENGVLVQSIRPDGTVVHYENGRIQSIETALGVYTLVYVEDENGTLLDVRVRLDWEEGTPELPLVPFLEDPETIYTGTAEIAGEAATLSQIFFARPLYNALRDPSGIQTTFDAAPSTPIFFANVLEDAVRGLAYEFGADYDPQWAQVMSDPTSLNSGYITYHKIKNEWDDLPGKNADLIDLNGDGLLDRVYMNDGSADYWWVQFNTGLGFADPVQWGGLDQRFYRNDTITKGNRNALRHYEGRHPHVLADLIDINGDGLPDRVLQKHYGQKTWYVQLNNGRGFDPVNAHYKKPVTTTGDAKIVAAGSKFGGASGRFDGSGDYLTLEDSADFDFGTGDFTVDFWTKVNATNGSRYFFSRKNDQFAMRLNGGNLEVLLSGSVVLRRAWTPAADTWHHLAVSRSGTELRLFVDGVQQGSVVTNSWNINLIGDFAVGARSGGTYGFDGWIDEFRVSKGEARFTEDFTPAEAAYERDQATVLLLHMEGEDEATRFVDDAKALEGFWNIHPTSQYSFQATYAQEVRDDQNGKSVQELIADLVDLDGDGLPDRVIRPWVAPYSHWFFQKNMGDHFADAVLWEGVDPVFNADEKMGGSLSWYFKDSGGLVSDLSDLVDLNGDNRPDRVLLKSKDPTDSGSAQEWYVQFNNGEGFDPPVLWDSDVRALAGAPTLKSATSIRVFDGWNSPRNLLVDLRDVTGDGLVDRVTVDQNSTNAQTTWWVEVNTGTTFAKAVAWTGVEGATGEETALGQDTANFRSNSGGGGSPTTVKVVSSLADINGDGILDRVIFPAGQNYWKVQFGTGSGFLPAQTMKIDALTASTESVRTSRYDYLHVSLRAESPVPAAAGRVRVTLGDPGVPETYQEWVIEDLGTEWGDFYLPLDKSKGNVGEVKVSFEPEGGTNIPLYIDNVTFVATRPPASKDWLDRFLAEENILAEIHSERTQTLAGYLGLSEATFVAPEFDWGKLLASETRIQFDETGEAVEFETLYGSISKLDNGRVVETILPDGTLIEFSAPTEAEPQRTAQTIIAPDGTAQSIDYAYGRVRTVSRPDGNPLEYSYEFDPDGREITVVYDPDTGMTERYRDDLLIARTEASGVTTNFLYNENGDRVRTTISYKGRVRQTFEHGTTESGNQLITTEDGIIEEYSPDGTILFHTTPEGYRYAHTFERARKAVTEIQTETVELPDGTILTVEIPVTTLVDDPEGEELHRVTLVSYTNEAGETAEYHDGYLISLRLADGTLLEFDRIETQQIADPETGKIRVETSLLDVVVRHPDGTITEYRNGKPFSVTSATGRVISLETEDGILLNANESAAFHLGQAEKLWLELVNPKWAEFQLPGTLSIRSEYDGDGKIVTRQFAEGVIELYEEGRIQQVLARDGELLIRYDYDEEGNPIRIEMTGARRRLELSVLRIQAEIEMQREEALRRVAEREEVLNLTVEGEYLVMRDRLLRIRARIEAQRASLASLQVRGKAAAAMIADAMAKINGALGQVDAALKKLAKQRSETLAELHQQVQNTYAEIQTETQNAYTRVDEESQKVREQIFREEVIPLVHHWYRKILGRDPNEKEIEAWIPEKKEGEPPPSYETGSFDLEALKMMLLTSEEFAARKAEVDAIRAGVRTELTGYLALSQEDKLAYALGLGIPEFDLVALSEGEVDKFLEWLDSRSLHFGQSAFLALRALLDDAGVQYDKTELAARLIVIDVLAGILTPMEQGDLILSLYAMKKVAASYGLETFAMKFTYEALKALYDAACPDGEETCDFRLVAHINGNHYIIVTYVGLVGIKDAEGNIVLKEGVNYIDPGAGPGGALQVVTLAMKEFLEAWLDPRNPDAGFGYVLSPRPPPESVSPDKAQLLTPDEEKTIRGAFFFFIFAAIFGVISAVVSAVVAAVTAIVAIIGALVSAIGAFLGAAFTAIGLFAGNFVAALGGLFGGILNAVGFTFAGSLVGGIFTAAGSFIAGFGAFLGTLFGGILGFAGGLITFGAELISAIAGFALVNFKWAALLSLGFQGLQAFFDLIGVSPKLSRSILAGGKIVAGIALMFVPGGQLAGLGLIAGGTSELLSLHTSLPPIVNQIIGISAAALAAFAGGGIDAGSLSGALTGLKSALPYLVKDFAMAGVMAVGDALGLDPRLTSLISIPVNAAVAGFLGEFGGDVTGVRDDGTIITVSNPWNTGSFLSSIANSFGLQLEAVGLNFGGQTQNSLFGSLLSGDILSSVGSLLGNGDLFGDILEILKDAVLSPFHLIDGVVRNFTYLITDFSSLISDKGIVGALETVATSLFSRQTIEELFNLGGFSGLFGSVSKTFTTLVTGETVQELKISDLASVFFDVAGNFFGVQEGGVLRTGTFGLDPSGKWGLLTGKVVAFLGNYLFTGKVDGGRLLDFLVSDAQAEPIFRGSVEGGDDPIVIDGPDSDSGGFWDLVLEILPLAIDLFFDSGILTQVEAKPSSGTPQPSSSGGTTATDELYVLANGIGNTSATQAPAYIQNLMSDLKTQSQLDPNLPDITDQDLLPIPLYPPMTQSPTGNKIIDALKWIIESQNPTVHSALTATVSTFLAAASLVASQRPIVGMGYSGGLIPLIEGLATGAYNIAGIVGLGAATMALGDLLPTVLEIVQFIEGKIIDGIEGLLSKIGIVGELAASFINFVQEHLIDAAIDILQAALAPLQKLPSNLPSLAGKAEFIVNLWGTEDILYKTGIAGYRENLAGLETINIEIVGATHFDYMRRNDADAWNITVSRFVTRLLQNSTDISKLRTFLEQNRGFFDATRNTWVVNL